MNTASRLVLMTAAISALLLPFSAALAGQDHNPESARVSPTFVRTISFRLRQGPVVEGRLIEQSRDSFTVEQQVGSRLEINEYGRVEIDTPSINISNVPEIRYYIDQGDYFYGRTWQFENDPDAFALAGRSYRRAVKLMKMDSERYANRIEQYENQIELVEREKQLWVEAVSERAELVSLEDQAMYSRRVEQLQQRLDESEQQFQQVLNEYAHQLEQTQQRADAAQRQYEQLQGQFTQLQQRYQQVQTYRTRTPLYTTTTRYRLYPRSIIIDPRRYQRYPDSREPRRPDDQRPDRDRRDSGRRRDSERSGSTESNNSNSTSNSTSDSQNNNSAQQPGPVQRQYRWPNNEPPADRD